MEGSSSHGGQIPLFEYLSLKGEEAAEERFPAGAWGVGVFLSLPPIKTGAVLRDPPLPETQGGWGLGPILFQSLSSRSPSSITRPATSSSRLLTAPLGPLTKPSFLYSDPSQGQRKPPRTTLMRQWHGPQTPYLRSSFSIPISKCAPPPLASGGDGCGQVRHLGTGVLGTWEKVREYSFRRD